jgi:hypothetical protein
LDITKKKNKKKDFIYSLIAEKIKWGSCDWYREGKTEWVNSSFEKCQVILRGIDRNKSQAICYKAQPQILRLLIT